MRLKNKTAVITGAGSGMGKAAAVLFAKEGASVVVAEIEEESGRETVSLIKEKGGAGLFVKTDVSIVDDVRRMIASARDAFGQLHIMYNNAAIFQPGINPKDQNTDGRVTDISEEVFDRFYNINLRSTFLCCKYSIPAIISSGGGSIINVASTCAVMGFTGVDAYTASKGGVLSLTRSMAVEYAPHNVRINCIIPGFIATPMVATQMKDPVAAKKFLDKSPTGKFGKPEDIAHLALYLASDESSFAIGGIFTLDGGMTIV
jgi:NAD(P)-dependent dehydrogenase (short-subunit alcohol dehydrogenase family)